MREMQIFEYSYIAQELQFLLGQRFSKIYDLGERKLRIKIGQTDIIIELGKYIYIASKIPEAIKLSNFSQKARKHLDGKKIKNIYQLNNDRLIVFEFDGYAMIFEMFARGNALLLHEGKILACYSNEQWKDRTIRPGYPYVPPPTHPTENLEVSKNFIISDLLHLPFGLLYAKEALHKCNLDAKQVGASLKGDEIACLKNAFADFKKHTKPYVFFQDNQPIGFGLAIFSEYKNYQQYDTLSNAIEQCIVQPENEEKNEALQKLQRRLEKQQTALTHLLQEEKELKEKGDYLFVEYEKINTLLNLAKAQKWDELSRSNVKIDKKKKEIEF